MKAEYNITQFIIDVIIDGGEILCIAPLIVKNYIKGVSSVHLFFIISFLLLINNL